MCSRQISFNRRSDKPSAALQLFPGCCAAPSARLRASLTRYDLRRGALLIRGPSWRWLCYGSRLCGAAQGALHRVRDTSAICSRCRVVICPSGGLLTGVSSPLCKNISVFTHPKSPLQPSPSHPTRGAYHDRHGRGVGCGGRGSVLRARGSQGGFFESVSDHQVC